MASLEEIPNPRVKDDDLSADDDDAQDQQTGADLPMSMTASVILANLPKDASQALQEIDAINDHKGLSLSLFSSKILPPLCFPSKVSLFLTHL